MIAKKFGVSKSAVEKIYKKYLVHKTVENLSGRERKRCTTAKKDCRIIHKCRQNPRKTSRNIVEMLELNVSSKTIRRRLQELGLRYCKSKCKPYINQTNMKKRLAFAKKYVNMPISFWRKIIWNDESKFELQQLKKKHYVLRKKK